MIIGSVKVNTSKNKNIDHRVIETCTIVSTQVTYRTDSISLLCDSTISSSLKFHFFYIFCYSLKEKDFNEMLNSKCLYVKSVLLLF